MGYKLSKEWALKQARERHNERAGNESSGVEKASGGQTLDRLDHLDGRTVGPACGARSRIRVM